MDNSKGVLNQIIYIIQKDKDGTLPVSLNWVLKERTLPLQTGLKGETNLWQIRISQKRMANRVIKKTIPPHGTRINLYAG